MESKNITYLFGAGASANVLPVVRDIPKRLAEFEKVFSKEEFSKTDGFLLPVDNRPLSKDAYRKNE